MQNQQNYPPPPYGSTENIIQRIRRNLSRSVVTIAIAVFTFLVTIGISLLSNQSGNSFVSGIISFFQSHSALTIVIATIFTIIPALFSIALNYLSPKTHKVQAPPIYPSNTDPYAPYPYPPDPYSQTPYGQPPGVSPYPAQSYPSTPGVPPQSAPPTIVLLRPESPKNLSRIDLVTSWLKEDEKFETELRSLLFQSSVLKGEATIDARYIDQRFRTMELLIAALQKPKDRRLVEMSTIMSNVITPICTVGLLAVGIVTILITVGHH